MAASPQTDREQDARTRSGILLAGGGLVLGLATLLLPHPEPFRPGLLVAAVVASSLIFLGLRWRRLAGFLDTWGDVLAVATVALVVAGTGGADSVYQDLYLLPLLAAAALHPVRRMAGVVALTFVALLLPFLYGTIELAGPFLTDLIVDSATWVLAAGVVHRQAQHHRRQEAEARASEDRFRRLAEHAQDGIYRLRLDPDVRFEYVNPAMEEVTGFPPDDFYADPGLPLRRVHPDDRGVIRRSRTDPRALPDTVEVRWQHRDGRWVWHALREAAIVEDGELVAIHGIVRDVTAQKIREEELELHLARQRETAEDLRQMDAAKTTTIRAVAHDLRSPLMTIDGFTKMLRDRWDDLSLDEIDHMLARIGGSTRRLERILNDLLDLEQIGAAAIARGPVDLRALARSVVEEVDAPEHDVEILSPPDTDTVVSADAAKLQRAIENLLVNAVRHTPAGSHVVVRVERDGTGACVIVEDDGPGVPDELKASIFEPFERGDTRGEGTGVGLSLVRAIAELHAGRAWVEDAEGGGARFVLSVPNG